METFREVLRKKINIFTAVHSPVITMFNILKYFASFQSFLCTVEFQSALYCRDSFRLHFYLPLYDKYFYNSKYS